MKLNPAYRFFIGFSSYVIRILLASRYRVQVKGFEEVLKLKNSEIGVLFLPNHPAEVDPIILMSILGPYFCPRSVVVEHFYHLKGFKVILDLARVVPVPSMAEKANQWRGKELAKVFEKIKEAIENGDHFLIYPSGKLKRTGLERLGGASFVHNLLQEKPDIPVVLIRTTGLWGSSFSVAQTGETPSFGSTLFKNGLVILKNLLFFVPKRDVLVEFEVVSKTLPIEAGRLEFNLSLEEWYNRYPFPGQETLSLVPYSVWKKEQVVIKALDKNEEEEERISVSLKIEKDVFDYLGKLSKMNPQMITNKMNLSFDLGLDSLDVAQVYVFLDRKYGLTDLPVGSLIKVADIFKAILAKETIGEVKEIQRLKPSSFWSKKEKRPSPTLLQGDVIAEVFLESCRKRGALIAAADHASGVFSYRKLKIAALTFMQKIKEMPGERIGVLLPSSIGAYLSILAVFLAGKIPVMLNWTAGRASLAHALKIGEFQSTITSKKFLDRISLEDLNEVEETFMFLEDIKHSLTWKEKLRAVWFSLFSVKRLMNQLNIQKDPDATAVLLFTSGTESLPKAVPLSHRNILTNQRNTLACVNLESTDVMYGVLPPFHSFGFSLTGLLPLLAGVKTFYGPDPTDSRLIASDIESASITLFCCAPSFIRSLFAVADPKQLQTLHILVAGAEKVPREVYEYIETNLPECVFIEGYGITECSPVISIQRVEEEKKGVGFPIPEVDVMIVDSFLNPLKTKQEGEVCISGPCVFNGYLGQGTDPFFHRDGKKWYRSGDLGYLNSDGTLYLTDRLKRVVKIGAEMVSLGGVEEELLHVAKVKMWYTGCQESPPLAVIAREEDSQKTEIMLFTVLNLDLEEVNQALRESGFGRIVKISNIIKISEIPLTGTGKIHHRALEERVKQNGF